MRLIIVKYHLQDFVKLVENLMWECGRDIFSHIGRI